MSTVLLTRRRKAAFPALFDGRQEIDDLDPGHEDLRDRRLAAQRDASPVDGPPGYVWREHCFVIDGLPEDIEDPSQEIGAHRHGYGPTGVRDHGSALKACGGCQGDPPDPLAVELLETSYTPAPALSMEQVIDGRQPGGKPGIHHAAVHLQDGSLCLSVFFQGWCA